jgi:hypothetical protein
MNKYAPVLIATLNRYSHFKRCIESLSVCTGAESTDLFIALDYPLNDSHWDGYRMIEQYLETIHGFQSVKIIKRDINFGAQKNFTDALNEMFKIYDRVIVSEDDNEFSFDFLTFVNRGLDVYKDRPDIFSISGYNYPVEIPMNYQNDCYIWQGFSGWGVGIWKDKWEKLYRDVDLANGKTRKFIKNFSEVYKLNKVANHYIPGLIHMLEKNTFHGDTYICMCMYVNKMYSLFPSVSRVRNMGHDGSGINGGILEDDIYKKQRIFSGNISYVLPLDIKQNEEINAMLRSYWRRSFKSMVKTSVKLALIILGYGKASKHERTLDY